MSSADPSVSCRYLPARPYHRTSHRPARRPFRYPRWMSASMPRQCNPSPSLDLAFLVVMGASIRVFVMQRHPGTSNIRRIIRLGTQAHNGACAGRKHERLGNTWGTKTDDAAQTVSESSQRLRPLTAQTGVRFPLGVPSLSFTPILSVPYGLDCQTAWSGLTLGVLDPIRAIAVSAIFSRFAAST